MGIEELRVRYEHAANCSGKNFTPLNERGLKTCLDCAGVFDSEGKGVWVTDKRFDAIPEVVVIPEEPVEENPNPDFGTTPVTLTISGDATGFDWEAYINDPENLSTPWTFEWENIPEPRMDGPTEVYQPVFAAFSTLTKDWIVQFSDPRGGAPEWMTNMVYEVGNPLLAGYGNNLQTVAEGISGHTVFPEIPFPLIESGDIWQLQALSVGYDEVLYHHNAVTLN